MSDYDVVVVGGGAAGLSAALVLSRARRTVLVVDAGSPRNAPAAHLQGYLSRDGMPPSALLEIGREEATGYGAELRRGVVAEVGRGGSRSFFVLLEDGTRVSARRLLIATGLRDELPAIPGLADRWGRDVLHCPYCHGWEVRDRRLGVLWNGPETVRFTQIVRQWAADVVLFVPPRTLTEAHRPQLVARAIGIVERDVAELVVEDDHLSAVRLTEGRPVVRDAVFVPPRFVPNNAVLTHLGADLDADGWVVTDPHGATSVRGVWVAGNVMNPRAQVITAAREGSAAAVAVNADLVDEDVRDAVRAFYL